MRHVTVIRPYGLSIRQRVFALLERAGLAVRSADVVPKGTTDEDVIHLLKGRPPEILLVPFHAHRDGRGEIVNGLDLLERLAGSVPLERVPVIMPVSAMALPAAHLKLSPSSAQPFDVNLRSNVLLLDESELDHPESVAAVVQHVRRHEAPTLR